MRQHSTRRQRRPDEENNQMSKPIEDTRPEDSMVFEKLNVNREGAVLFATINAPPMNLEGPELVRDLVSLIQLAEADDTVQVIVFKSADPDYFISHVDVTRIKENREAAAKLDGEASIGLVLRHLSASRLVTIAQIEYQRRMQFAMKRGFQTRDAEMNLGQLVADI